MLVRVRACHEVTDKKFPSAVALALLVCGSTADAATTTSSTVSRNIIVTAIYSSSLPSNYFAFSLRVVRIPQRSPYSSTTSSGDVGSGDVYTSVHVNYAEPTSISVIKNVEPFLVIRKYYSEYRVTTAVIEPFWGNLGFPGGSTGPLQLVIHTV